MRTSALTALLATLQVLILCTLLWTPPVAAAAPRIEHKIHQVEQSLLQFDAVNGQDLTPTPLAARMAELHVPGVSITMIHKGRIEWARGFGVTRIDGPIVTPRTLFQAASISTLLTALEVLRLVQSGRLDLDTDVNEYLKHWKIPPARPWQARVTLRQLLGHRAGLTVHDFPGYPVGADLPTLIQILDGQAPANTAAIRVDVQPGTISRYSGGGYVVIQQLLQDITGAPFATLMRDAVLQPIGMERSSFEQPLPHTIDVALPYRADGEPVEGGAHLYPEQAAAGLWTTPSDLARYAIEVQRAVAGKSDRMLSAAMTREMLRPDAEHAGLGLQVDGKPKHRYFEHEGSSAGYRCKLLVYQRGDGVIVMTNGDNGGQLAREIVRTLARAYAWPDFQPSSP